MRVRRLLAAAALVVAAGACAAKPPAPPGEPLPLPDPSNVEHAVFIVGDPGQAIESYYPILPRLAQDVEFWSGSLARDSAVFVLILGDVIYPNGMHDPTDREDYPRDSLLVADQLDIVSGPNARQYDATMYFLAGNHDWGSEQHEEGVETIRNLEDHLTRHREQLGLNVRLVPDAGTPGPAVVDAGPHLRMVILDTAWWLLQSRGAQADTMFAGIENALRTADDRHVVIAAHHPFTSAGPHGGELSFLEELGIGYVLKRAGAILQDMNSPPYRRLRAGLGGIFERAGQPLLFAGGHEHSLQLIAARRADEPRWSVVSGSASKITRIGSTDGMRFGVSAPGYFLLLVRTDGTAELHAYAAPIEYLSCPESPVDARERCMAEGIAAYVPRHTQVLTD